MEIQTAVNMPVLVSCIINNSTLAISSNTNETTGKNTSTNIRQFQNESKSKTQMQQFNQNIHM